MSKVIEKTTEKLPKYVRRLTGGTYEARKMINGRTIRVSGKNLTEVMLEFEFKIKCMDNPYLEGARITLDEWFDTWFKTYKEPNICQNSIYPMRNKYNSTFGKKIRNMYLADIRNIHIQKTLKELSDEGKAASTLREALGRVRECLESAKNNRYIQDNPCFDIIVPWKRTTSKRRFLTVKEQNDFLESVRTNQSYFYPMIKIMLQTGLRVSEVGGLRWGDIDFKNKVIHVQRALTCNYEYGKKVMRMSPTKTQNSVREIPFMGDVEEQLINQKKQQDQTKENLGERYRSEEGEFTDLVFTTSMGSPMIRHNAQKIITRAVKAYNLEEGARAVQENRVPVYMEPVSPHALRRTFCTRCFEAGINPKVVQSVMGHATYSTTIDIYTEVMGEMKESELAKFTLDVNTKDIINQN